jgi:hypothetical protein
MHDTDHNPLPDDSGESDDDPPATPPPVAGAGLCREGRDIRRLQEISQYVDPTEEELRERRQIIQRQRGRNGDFPGRSGKM